MLRFKFITNVAMRDLGYWDVTPCSLVLSTEISNLIITSILKLYGKLQTLKMVVSYSFTKFFLGLDSRNFSCSCPP